MNDMGKVSFHGNEVQVAEQYRIWALGMATDFARSKGLMLEQLVEEMRKNPLRTHKSGGQLT